MPDIKLYTVDEAAAILGKSPVTVRQNMRTHKIGRKLGREWVLTDPDLDRLRKVPKPGHPIKGQESPGPTKPKPGQAD